MQANRLIPSAIQSGHLGVKGEPKLVRRSTLFNAESLTDTNTSFDSAKADSSKPSGNVTFNFMLSPIVWMPPLKILRMFTIFKFKHFFIV